MRGRKREGVKKKKKKLTSNSNLSRIYSIHNTTRRGRTPSFPPSPLEGEEEVEGEEVEEKGVEEVEDKEGEGGVKVSALMMVF